MLCVAASGHLLHGSHDECLTWSCLCLPLCFSLLRRVLVSLINPSSPPRLRLDFRRWLPSRSMRLRDHITSPPIDAATVFQDVVCFLQSCLGHRSLCFFNPLSLSQPPLLRTTLLAQTFESSSGAFIHAASPTFDNSCQYKATNPSSQIHPTPTS